MSDKTDIRHSLVKSIVDELKDKLSEPNCIVLMLPDCAKDSLTMDMIDIVQANLPKVLKLEGLDFLIGFYS